MVSHVQKLGLCMTYTFWEFEIFFKNLTKVGEMFHFLPFFSKVGGFFKI